MRVVLLSVLNNECVFSPLVLRQSFSEINETVLTSMNLLKQDNALW